MLSARQVSFRYPQDGQGLPPTSLEIAPGDLTLITGPSGCGKSTLARCLVGIIPHLYRGHLSGEVWLDGCRTSETDMWQLAEKAGMVFQNPAAQMLAPSVEDEIIFGLENLGLPRDVIAARLESVLDEFELTTLRQRDPHTLSGGEQQKLALAAIMARRPGALVLDEPLSMLDTSAAAHLVAYLERLAREGKAVAVFDHRREALEELPGLRLLELKGGATSTHRVPQPPLPASPTFRLEIAKLGVRLGGHTVFDDLHLSLASGQIVAVVGRNGAGKTTLLRSLCGLQRHTGMAEVVSGTRHEMPDFGMVFQNPDLQLFNASVHDEILYRLPRHDETYYRWLLSALGLERYEQTPPLLLSEGEKKRLALALVLMRRPTHGILLDEPSLGQDDANKAILTGMLRALADSGQLVILTTHDLSLAAHADRLILLAPDGRIAADDSTQQVLSDGAAWERTGLPLPAWFRRAQGKERAQ